MEKHRKPFIEISVEAIEEVIPSIAKSYGFNKAFLMDALVELWFAAAARRSLTVHRKQFDAMFQHLPHGLLYRLIDHEFLALGDGDTIRILVGGHVRIAGAQ